MRYVFYENDQGDPRPYARIHTEECSYASAWSAYVQPHNRWIAAFHTFEAAEKVAVFLKSNVRGCSRCGTNRLFCPPP